MKTRSPDKSKVKEVNILGGNKHTREVGVFQRGTKRSPDIHKTIVLIRCL